VQDTELAYTQKGTAVCKFSVACNRFFKREEEMQKEVSFFEVSTWARLAEVYGESLQEGRGVRVVGRLRQDRWTDQEGKPQFKKQEGDGKNGDEKTDEPAAAEEQVQEEAELKEAASI
jgi:single-strand DNA-binding protein